MSDLTNCTASRAMSATPSARQEIFEEALDGGGPELPAGLDLVELPDLPGDCGIRETLLWRFSDPADDGALRRVGDMLTELVNESGQFGPRPEASVTREELRAVALDLFVAARHLGEVAADRHASQLEPEDARLAEQAELWGARVTLVAAMVWEVVDGEGA